MENEYVDVLLRKKNSTTHAWQITGSFRAGVVTSPCTTIQYYSSQEHMHGKSWERLPN
jgi:hypothetical protein